VQHGQVLERFQWRPLSNSFAWGDSRELDYIDVDCASVMVAVGAADIARERATD